MSVYYFVCLWLKKNMFGIIPYSNLGYKILRSGATLLYCLYGLGLGLNATSVDS